MTAGLQLSLTDIAHLAQVQRPVVSMWRTRSASSDFPFPPPLTRVAGQERFDTAAVVDWLEATRRGNNRDVRADSPAWALPVGMSLRDDPVLFAGLSALLCLKVMSGADLAGVSPETLLELARHADPGDWLMVREISGLGAQLSTIAGYTEHLADAAFGSAEAFEGLLAERFRHGLTSAVQSALAVPVHDLVTTVARSLARTVGVEPPRYVDATGAGSDLLLSMVLADADQSPDVFVPYEDTPAARLFRRRLHVHDVLIESLSGAVANLGPAVLLAQFPVSGRPDMTGEEILDAIDETAISMDDRQRAVLVAPASLLTDRLRDRSLHQLRSRVLRAGRVRAMVRLPAGLVTHRSRQALALWVLGPDFEDHALGERRIAVIDVSDETLTKLLIGQIADDVVAAMTDPRLSRAHSYARARLVPTSTVLAQTGGLLPPQPTVTRSETEPAAAALLIERLRTNPPKSGDALGDVVVAVRESHVQRSVPLGEAIRQRLVRVLPGNRHGFDLRQDGTVPVLGVPELTSGATGRSRRVDRLTFLGTYDAARLTEAGDVVFCTSPYPCAAVDEAGGSAVQYPARVLRIDPLRGEGLSPYVIASAINAQPAASRAWRNWSLPRVPAGQVVPVAAALGALDRERAATHAQLAELDELHRTLVQGVASGSLVLHTDASTPNDDTKDN